MHREEGATAGRSGATCIQPVAARLALGPIAELEHDGVHHQVERAPQRLLLHVRRLLPRNRRRRASSIILVGPGSTEKHSGAAFQLEIDEALEAVPDPSHRAPPHRAAAPPTRGPPGSPGGASGPRARETTRPRSRPRDGRSGCAHVRSPSRCELSPLRVETQELNTGDDDHERAKGQPEPKRGLERE